MCTGKEERLLDCDFPEDFGEDDSSSYDSSSYSEYELGPANAPQPTPMENAPASSGGQFSFSCARSDNGRLGVICRRFEMTGTALASANFIRCAPTLRRLRTCPLVCAVVLSRFPCFDERPILLFNIASNCVRLLPNFR